MSKIVLIFLLIFIGMDVQAAKPYNENYYQTKWCSRWHGSQEVVLADKTRVDCVTKNYAVEFDFAPKWAEAIGQSLYYAEKTNKKPAIILIIEKPSDFKYYRRARLLSQKYNFTLWYMLSPTYNLYKVINDRLAL